MVDGLSCDESSFLDLLLLLDLRCFFSGGGGGGSMMGRLRASSNLSR